MKDIGEMQYILGIRSFGITRKERLCCLGPSTLTNFWSSMWCKTLRRVYYPLDMECLFLKIIVLKWLRKKISWRTIPYASMVGSLMYAMSCTRPDICFAIRMMSRYQYNLGMEHWMAVNHILKYLRRMRDYMLVYQCNELLPLRYTNLDF